jgi:hypothetical protein
MVGYSRMLLDHVLLDDIIASSAPWADCVRPNKYGGVHDPSRRAIERDPLTDKSRDVYNETTQMLGEGQWLRRVKLVRIAQRHGVALTVAWRIWDSIGVAESDSGAWVCLPRDWTPELAPDGT